MIVYNGLDNITETFSNCTVAIGAFDGIHVGHAAIIRTAVSDAAARNGNAVVLTFDRHPAEVLRPDHVPDYLSTPQQREALMLQLGVDRLVVAHFDRKMSELTAESFVHDVLTTKLGARTIVVGFDFRFGKNRTGDVTFLKSRGLDLGFKVVSHDPVLVDGEPVSSTRIRDLIRSGEIENAERLLGHQYWLAGTVAHGKQLGRTLGFPTANLNPIWRQAVPPDGVWAVRVKLEGGAEFDGACSIGTRPAVEQNGARTIETYILDFDRSIYDLTIELRFLSRLREERNFPDMAQLKLQINDDVDVVRRLAESRILA